MGKLKVFEVLLTGNREVFKPGDVVQGEARIVVSEDKGDIRDIRVKCIGRSFTCWSKGVWNGEGVNQVLYYTDHEFFREEITLQSAGNDNSAANRITLTAGEHRFPFQFEIPNMTLPPPFEDPFGIVRYCVKCTIGRPWKINHRTQKLFSIGTVKDLNYDLNVLVPASNQVEKTVCCFCCASGPIVLKGMIDKRGYVPGEYIFVSLDLHNNSSRRINYVTAKLQQRGHFTAKREGTGKIGYQKTVKTMAELKLAGCEAMGSVNYDRVKMLIPPIPSCDFENCPNITLEYFVEIVGDVFGTHKNALVNLPVVIGTIPAFQHTLKNPSQNPDAVQSIPGQPGAPPQGQPGISPEGQQGYPPPRDGSSGYPLPGGVSGDEAAGLLPPPKYTTAVGGPQKIVGKYGTFGKIFYAPQYPYYDPDTMYASMGIPLGATTSSADGGQPHPIVVQPMSIQQPPQQT